MEQRSESTSSDRCDKEKYYVNALRIIFCVSCFCCCGTGIIEKNSIIENNESNLTFFGFM